MNAVLVLAVAMLLPYAVGLSVLYWRRTKEFRRLKSLLLDVQEEARLLRRHGAR